LGKLDLRVGEVLEIEDVPGADKLYKLKIDFGNRNKNTCCWTQRVLHKKKN